MTQPSEMIQQNNREAVFCSGYCQSLRASQRMREIIVNGVPYFRLSPQVYAWLHAKVARVKIAFETRRVSGEVWDSIRSKFNAIHDSAVAEFGIAELDQAVKACHADPSLASHFSTTAQPCFFSPTWKPSRLAELYVEALCQVDRGTPKATWDLLAQDPTSMEALRVAAAKLDAAWEKDEGEFKRVLASWVETHRAEVVRLEQATRGRRDNTAGRTERTGAAGGGVGTRPAAGMETSF